MPFWYRHVHTNTSIVKYLVFLNEERGPFYEKDYRQTPNISSTLAGHKPLIIQI